MNEPQDLNETQIMLIGIKSDLGSIKTDVVWLKRLFGGVIVVIAAVFGVDVTGLV